MENRNPNILSETDIEMKNQDQNLNYVNILP